MSKQSNTLLVKNMVCPRCILTVENILDTLKVPFSKVSLGEIELSKGITNASLGKLEVELKKVGFELIETRVRSIIEKIKVLVLDYLGSSQNDRKIKLSSFITGHIHYDYSYLSDLFSSVEGITIEQYFIFQRIEKVKELLVYDQLSLTEIAYHTGYSSVHHLSSQFKKVTGLTPSHFKKVGVNKRKSIDNI
jgi:AraC family transcriptional regulator